MIVERPALERRVSASLDAGRIPVVLGGCATVRTSLLLRLEHQLGRDRSQYSDVSAVATTPERCLRSIRAAARWNGHAMEAPVSARAAFEAMLSHFDATTDSQATPTFLLDEFLDVRTFESFPGLRQVQRELVTRLASSPSRFVLASRFTSRVHRLLRDAPARFEVVHVPALDADEVQALALKFEGGRRDWAANVAPSVAALCNGRAGYVTLLLGWLAASGPATDPIAGLSALLSPDGHIAARCRESYEFRLQRARGYGALKAILGVLAESEPLNLTEIAQHLQRTPGSTKDYLSWLEDVDLITARSKRYSFEDPMLRLYVRLYGRVSPPTDDEIVREVGTYARAQLAQIRPVAAVAVPAASDALPDTTRSGIIEID